MAGYDYVKWMSNGAVDAYDNEERPISKWTKAAILEYAEAYGFSASQIASLKRIPLSDIKARALYRSSWHHTSSHYNRTDFYSLDLDILAELADSPPAKAPARRGAEKPSQGPYRAICDYDRWTGTRAHPRKEECRGVLGTVRGKMFYADNGDVKRLSSCRQIFRVDERCAILI